MHVGLLAYGLERPLSGVTRVALELGRALRADESCRVTFLTTYRAGPFVGDPGTASVFLPGCRLLPGLMLLGGPLITAAARRLGIDVVHDPLGISPFTVPRSLAPYRRLVTVHDAIAFEASTGYPLLNRLLHRVYMPATFRNIDAFATVSQHARAALVRHLGLPSERIGVVPNGVSGVFRPVEASRARATVEALGIRPPYVLYVGAFQARKNLLGLIDAFLKARDRLPDHQLVLAGPVQWSYPALQQRLATLPHDARVNVVGYVPEPHLPSLYSAADVFVLPSMLEGFGIPVLEAMACGTPVVCSTATSLPEVAGDAAVLIDPYDHAALADALVAVARDGALASQLRTRGLERAKQFTWARAARDYAEMYARI
jgi:glycosyltransferase involved in cell wall biosynthesis